MPKMGFACQSHHIHQVLSITQHTAQQNTTFVCASTKQKTITLLVCSLESEADCFHTQMRTPQSTARSPSTAPLAPCVLPHKTSLLLVGVLPKAPCTKTVLSLSVCHDSKDAHGMAHDKHEQAPMPSMLAHKNDTNMHLGLMVIDGDAPIVLHSLHAHTHSNVLANDL